MNERVSEWMCWMAGSNNRGGVLCNTSQCSLLVTRLFYTQTLCRIVEALKRQSVAYWVPTRASTFTGQAGCNRCGWSSSSSSNILRCSVHVVTTQRSVCDVFFPDFNMEAVELNNILNFIVHLCHISLHWLLQENEQMSSGMCCCSPDLYPLAARKPYTCIFTLKLARVWDLYWTFLATNKTLIATITFILYHLDWQNLHYIVHIF